MSDPIQEIFISNRVDLSPAPVNEDLVGLARRTKPAAPVKAVVFDVYGTLFISASGDISLDEDTTALEHRLRFLLNEYDIDCSPHQLSMVMKEAVLADHTRRREELGVEYPEVDIREIWRMTGELDHLGDADLALFAAAYESLVNPVSPMPGLSDVLECLKAAGIPLGIVSNAQFYTPAMFPAFLGKSLLQLGFHPDLLLFSYREGHGKPSTHLYELLAQRLANLQYSGHASRSISSENCLYVGNDMLKDVWAAAQLGFQTALFAGDGRSCRTRRDDVRCSSLQADFVLNTLDGICRLIL